MSPLCADDWKDAVSMPILSRRVALGGLALAPFAAHAQAQTPTGTTPAGTTPAGTTPAGTRLRISTAAPPGDFLAKSLEGMKAELDGAKVGLAAEVYPAGTLFKQGTEVPAMQRGTLEMSTMTTFEVAQQIPQFGFFNRGYLFRDYGHMHRVFDGPIGAAYRKAVSQQMGIEILATAYLGTRQVNLRHRRPVKTPTDLAGVKLRMTPGPEWLLLGRAIGADPVPMGMAEVYLALKTGTVDGQENPLTILNAAKLYEVTEQVVLTAHMVQPVFINIATPAWAKLDAAQQAALRTAAGHAAQADDTGRLADEKTMAAGLAARGLSVDTPDLAAFRAHADTVYAASGAAKAWNADMARQVQDAA
jgi:tripartite ATP-independent transporter DctP family solute receptor